MYYYTRSDVRDLLLIRAAMRGGTAQGIHTTKYKQEVKHEKNYIDPVLCMLHRQMHSASHTGADRRTAPPSVRCDHLPEPTVYAGHRRRLHPGGPRWALKR